MEKKREKQLHPFCPLADIRQPQELNSAFFKCRSSVLPTRRLATSANHCSGMGYLFWASWKNAHFCPLLGSPENSEYIECRHMGCKPRLLPSATSSKISSRRLWHQWSGTPLPISGGGGAGGKGASRARALDPPPHPGRQIPVHYPRPCGECTVWKMDAPPPEYRTSQRCSDPSGTRL